MGVSAADYRNVIGSFGTGVTIVTTTHDGEPVGMTANAVASVSLDPILLLFCADKRSRTHEAIEQSGIFAVNLLTDQMQEASNLFASSGMPEKERFAAVKYETGETGAPLLTEALGWLDCRVKYSHPGGDHTIFVGEVVNIYQGEGLPLMYFQGSYRHLAPK